MDLNRLPIAGAIVIGLAAPLSGATLQVRGTISTFLGFDGNTITDGSTVEIGYFLGVSPSTRPSEYTDADWNSFTVLDSAQTSQLFGFLNGAVQISLDLDSETDFGVGEIPVRIGVKIIDSLNSAHFNVFTTAENAAVLELPSVPPTPGVGSADVAARSASDTAGIDFVWRDNANAFRTSIPIPIPEPSTSISALLGLGLIIGARRRK